MPERPELEYTVARLGPELCGRHITAVTVARPIVLRLAVEGGVEANLTDRTVTSIARHGHFLQLQLDGSPGREIVISPMLAGRLALVEGTARRTADLAIAWELDDGRQLRYRDRVQMGKVYVIPTGHYGHVPGFDRIGVDVLDAQRFTLRAFIELARKRHDQVKVFLLDKSALDSLGNAFADEALFEAGIHPKSWVRDLDDDDLERLHAAIPGVLRGAREVLEERAPPTDEKVRDFLSVRNRHKQACPRCGTAIRKAGVRGHDAFFCPQCQPDRRKSSLVDWRRGR